MTIVVWMLLIIGLFLAIYKPYLYVLYFGIIGSDMGAMGISGYFNQFFSLYSLVMQIFLVIAMFVSLVHYNYSSNIIKRKGWMLIACCLILFSSLSILLYSFSPNFSGSIIVRLVKCIGLYGPAVFMIWLSYSDKLLEHKKYFFYYVLIQCSIAMIIIYGPTFGINVFYDFNAALYMGGNSGYFYLDSYNSNVALLSNFINAFVGGKNSVFIKCAQFHNANGLGMAAGVLLFLLINKAFFENNNKKILYRIGYIVLIVLSFLLWCNTGTRGPIVGVLLALIWYIAKGMLSRKQISHNNFYLSTILITCVLFVFIIESDTIVSYFLGQGSKGSLNSRIVLLKSFFDNIWDYFFIGNAGNLDSLVSLGIDPHFLPMRVCCMYGIVPAILILVLVFVKPIKISLFTDDTSFYRVGCFLIVFLIGLTNNYAEPVLFWLLLSESLLDFYECRNQDIIHNSDMGV